MTRRPTATDGEMEAAAAGKENAPPFRRHLVAPTEEQRARITQNFRAAKALLARKRPRPSAPPTLSRNENVDVCTGPPKLQDPPIRRRIPLSGFWMARCLPSFNLGDFADASAYNDGFFTPVPTLPPPRVPSLGERVADGGFVTPVAEKAGCSRLGADVFTPSVYLDDDELDESVLREIDELCEQRSVGKIERPSSGSDTPDADMSCGNDLGDGIVANGVKESLVRSGEEKEISCADDDMKSPVPQAFLDYWQSLNDKQREAACSDISVPLMIMAGPGSGKTSTMVGRVLMLLKEGVHPSNILAMTFTTAAASEMRDRIGAVVGKAVAKALAISTFHSFSLQLCRLHAEKLGRTAEFLIYGHGQQRRAVIEAFRLFESENKDVENLEKHHSSCTIESFKVRSKKWEKFVTQAKASGRTPDDCWKRGDQLGAAILAKYNDILRSCNALDYHDFIICSVKLLTDFPDVCNECRESWRAIVVDEFQDTSSMQYKLLRILASHNCITVIGDDDQSIFSFNGADICSFDSFQKDFQTYKEVRLTINYRSTRFIVEAASSLIQNNIKRCQLKDVATYNSCGNKITVKECQNDAAQCAFAVDKILEVTSNSSVTKSSFGDIAVLYRRQVTGKAFQISFRDRKIPFNIHGVAFYRKKVTKGIIAILRTILPCCSDASARQSFKVLLVSDKEEKKKVIEYVEKISLARKCSFLSAASDIFHAKVSGTFKRAQLLQGKKVLSSLDMLSKLVHRERSITAVVSSVATMIPHRYLLEKRAVVDVDDGKYLNEDHDLRSVLEYLLDDVCEFLSTHFSKIGAEEGSSEDGKGCCNILEAFLDHISTSETGNFQSRKRENENSVTLTTIHQSKGLEWDTVFIVKANESEIPLLHEFNGVVKCGASLEEERRLFYVAMTRARKKLYILCVLMDSNWQFLQPSRFLKEIPGHLIEGKGDIAEVQTENGLLDSSMKTSDCTSFESRCKSAAMAIDKNIPLKDCEFLPGGPSEFTEAISSNTFLKRFNVEHRSIISHIFHQWAKKPIFQNPKRLLDKVGFVIDERLRNKANKNKDLLRTLKTSLHCDEAFQYAQHVLMWQQIPADKRAHLMREKQEHFQKKRIENAMGSSEATPKQISYLQMLGCTVIPTSRLHASNLIEQYKAL